MLTPRRIISFAVIAILIVVVLLVIFGYVKIPFVNDGPGFKQS
jgi:PDZ domain-containing secreted protein